MPQINDGRDAAGRRRKRFLSPSEKYEIWISLLRGEVTTREAADRAGVDRGTIMKLRRVAKEGALAALAAAEAEIARLSEALKEMAVKLMLLEGKDRCG